MSESVIVGIVTGVTGILGTLLGIYATWRLQLRNRRREECVRFLAVSHRVVNQFLSLIHGRDLVRRRLSFVALLNNMTDAQSSLLVHGSPRILDASDRLIELAQEFVPTVTAILRGSHPWRVANLSESPQVKDVLERWRDARGQFISAVDRELPARGFLARRRARSRWAPGQPEKREAYRKSLA